MRTVLERLAAAAFVGILVLLAGCTDSVRVTFESCQEAEAAGVMLPLTPGDVGWNKALDDDGDGLGCE
ncbi:excalibur calcium-binding domain-containing protein [Kribbella sp. NPDC050470]|uniref:excalibur calcium-binding domain-containing protein n=1 Tax=unclassified Kribbella TaxID=2644121 RepID=UPI0037B55AA9